MIDLQTYPLWHGAQPMGQLTAEMSAEDFLVEGKGVRVRDAGGRWYLDGRSSLWHATLGYDNGHVKDAVKRQLDELAVASLLSYNRPAAVTVQYARELVGRLPDRLTRVRFGNTGSQVVEMAFMAERYFRRLNGEPERTAVIAFWTSYHGSGPGASALTGNPLHHANSGQLVGDVHHVSPPMADPGATTCDAIRAKVEELGADRVAAVIIEPVIGNLGLRLTDEYLRDVERLCRETGIHLIADEVTTGFGRTGALSRTAALGIEPDMLLLGKGITAGYVPFAALVVSEEVFQAGVAPADTAPFLHGSTADGYPLGAAAGLAVLEVLDSGVLSEVDTLGKAIRDGVEALKDRHPTITEVDGAGLMIRIVLNVNGAPMMPFHVEQFRKHCEAAGLFVSAAWGSVMVCPPLVVTSDECAEIVELLDTALTAYEAAA